MKQGRFTPYWVEGTLSYPDSNLFGVFYEGMSGISVLQKKNMLKLQLAYFYVFK